MIRQTATGPWEISDSFKHGTRTIKAGTVVSIRGMRGRWRFIEHFDTGKVEWIDCVEIYPVNGLSKKEPIRAFRPDRVTRVHRAKASK